MNTFQRRKQQSPCDYKESKECNDDYDCEWANNECIRKSTPFIGQSRYELGILPGIDKTIYEYFTLADLYPSYPQAIIDALYSEQADVEDIALLFNKLPNTPSPFVSMLISLVSTFYGYDVFYIAGLSGHVLLIDEALERVQNNNEAELIYNGLARGGHIDLIYYLKQELIITDIHGIREYALEGNHMDIVEAVDEGYL